MKKILIIFITVITISCNNEKKVNPIFYEISNDKSEIYILGSIHSSDGSIFPLPDFVMNKFYQSEEFIMELKPLENDTLQNIQQLNEEEYNLKDHVSDDTYKKVVELSKNISIPTNILIKQNPLEIISLIEEYELEKVGINKNKGIESYLFYEAERKNIKVDGFDSFKEIVEAINLKDEKENEKRLREFIVNKNEIGENTKELLEFWKEGNEEKLLKKINEYSKKYSSLTQYLITKRNKKILRKIEEILTSQRKVFIAVGLGHIIGENNIIEMLQEKGYFIKKVKAT